MGVLTQQNEEGVMEIYMQIVDGAVRATDMRNGQLIGIMANESEYEFWLGGVYVAKEARGEGSVLC